MARKKVKLEWIVNDSARRATLKKRKKGLMKKVSELSTLCDVKACLIVYGPNEPQPEVWPSAPDAMRVLARLKKMPEMEQSKKMMNQEGFMRQRIMKLQEQLRKQDRENRELETTLLMYQGLAGKSLHTVSIEDMTSLAWLIEMKVNKVHERIEHSKGEMASKMVEGVKEEKKKVEGPSNIKEKTPLEVAMEELQRQDWFTEIMNPHDLTICGNEVVQPYIDHNNPWLDAYFP
ncbi:agamous-like MADS-box protein AGL80 [Phoenix dactylifera]|uniref:Agamous-like MADS-box protein AGL80 n=1 Tax=Phoenix dactylifera TaxID=42345 RepID=A0A8B7CL41_PHODC|nr:agamous-like MADS-box protein AGL80 [Phoenix dactylifera]